MWHVSNAGSWTDEKLRYGKLTWLLEGLTVMYLCFYFVIKLLTKETRKINFRDPASYLMSKVALVPLIMSPGPTGPALSEETAACKPGYNSLPERMDKLLFVVCLFYISKETITWWIQKDVKHLEWTNYLSLGWTVGVRSSTQTSSLLPITLQDSANETAWTELTFVVVSGLVCRRPERVFERSDSHGISEQRTDSDPPLFGTVTVTVRLVVVTGPSLNMRA